MKRIFAILALCLLLCGCAAEPQTKTVWLLTCSETYTDPGQVSKTEYIYDSEGYLRRQVSSYMGTVTGELLAARWDSGGNATMLVDSRQLAVIETPFISADTVNSLPSSQSSSNPLQSSSYYYYTLLPSCQVRGYNERGQLLYTAIATPGSYFSYSSDAYGTLTYTSVYTYDDAGNLICVYNPDSSSGYALFYRYTYEDGQKVQSRTYHLPASLRLDPFSLGEYPLSQYLVSTTVHGYDRSGRLIKDTTTFSTGAETAVTYEYHTDPGTGNTNCIRYQSGGATTVTVTDRYGNIIRQETDIGNEVMVTTYTYTPIQVSADSPRLS